MVYDGIMRMSRITLAFTAFVLAPMSISARPALAEPDAAPSAAPVQPDAAAPKSITKELASGDGKTQATAYVIFENSEMAGVDKEYEILRYLKLKPQSQALVTGESKTYDALTVIDPQTGDTRTVWFDISNFFGEMF
ncbi:hypothetical protein GCM10011614_32990 [Novosphingobium colocasiae]|uniref:Uncharacterized protein n=2 Tax=Novosphingobium colocasiae TaxID=1256513 RepID=A0A918PN76_9SPHN|nr:hypothetical protein GCM10011614_32990 [Novosphingobium colocasiae]